MFTTDEIIERGLAASSLLQNPTFQSVIKSLMFDCFTAFTESKPSQREGREDTYNLYRGLQAIEAELTARVQSYDQAVSRLDAENAERTLDAAEDAEVDLDAPFYTQGNTDQ